MTTGNVLSADNLVREFNEKVSVSSGESVTVTYVTSAMAVYERILKDDTCRAIVLAVPLPTKHCHECFPQPACWKL